ncbi:hypothetical protein SDC9_122319 [bioreactor metagenome]|uniref:Uncharacterized protein n=1 Tax=bioreactor metagenome TaxID=1076179 RepID=A0A645CEE2_9ZZZZ
MGEDGDADEPNRKVDQRAGSAEFLAQQHAREDDKERLHRKRHERDRHADERADGDQRRKQCHEYHFVSAGFRNRVHLGQVS